MIGRTNVGGGSSAPLYSIHDWCATIGLPYSVLADIPESDMRQLMTKYASVAYFMEWYSNEPSMIDDFIANAYAMKWIGLRDYICDKLLALQSVRTKMLASANWEYILKDHAPVMTSDTAPYGEAIGSAQMTTSEKLYYAFDGDESTNTATYDYYYTYTLDIGYRFTNPICVKKFHVILRNSDATYTATFKLVGSNDGTNWSDIDSWTETVEALPSLKYEFSRNISNDNYYLMYKLVRTGTSINCRFMVHTLQFYGRSVSVSVPKMKSNTAPYGTAFCSSYYNNNDAYNAYRVFDHSDSTEWATPTNKTVGEYVGYNFGKAVRLKGVRVKNWGSQGYGIASYRVEASNDGFSSDIHQLTASVSIALGAESYVAINTNTDYSSYRIYVLGVASGNTNCNIQHVNFFGVDYSERTDRTYLYDHGLYMNGMSHIEGVLATQSPYSGAGIPTVTDGSDSLKIEYDNNASNVYIALAVSTNTVSFSGYSYFSVQNTETTLDNGVDVYISSSRTRTDGIVASRSIHNLLESLDVSQVSGGYYIMFACISRNDYRNRKTIIEEIYLS